MLRRSTKSLMDHQKGINNRLGRPSQNPYPNVDFSQLAADAHPVCKRCAGEVRIMHDLETGEPVRHDGKALLVCTACGERDIGPDFIGARRRISLVVWILDIAFAIALLAGVAFELLRNTPVPVTGSGRTGRYWFMALCIICSAFFFHMVMVNVAIILTEKDLRERFETAAMALFYAVPAGFMLVVLFSS